MSRIVVDESECRGFCLSRYAGPDRMRMYQISNGTGFVQLTVVELLNLREVLESLCFCNPPCNEAEFHSPARKYHG